VIKVAIVDDSDAIRKSITALLDDIQEVTVCWQADSADSALNKLEDCSPDFIILDIRMPGKYGLEIISEIKIKTNCKIIIYTSYPYPLYKILSFNKGADFFIDKAENFQCIVDIIRGVNQ
jgi:DNA-binding NarL/FixJ family response regulator